MEPSKSRNARLKWNRGGIPTPIFHMGAKRLGVRKKLSPKLVGNPGRPNPQIEGRRLSWRTFGDSVAILQQTCHAAINNDSV
jgi:hypothetical protein